MHAGAKLPVGGIMLGASAGLMFVEPAGAVGANNELLAARGEAMTAEDDVSYSLLSRHYVLSLFFSLSTVLLFVNSSSLCQQLPI
jgi:hypothetical protein